MTDPLRDAIRHSAWATCRLLEVCRRLTNSQMAAEGPAGYGSLRAILAHLLLSEAFYRFVLTGSYPPWSHEPGESAPVPLMDAWAAEMTSFWEAFTDVTIDGDKPLIRTLQDGQEHEARTGIVLAQVLDHASAHREQAAAVLTTLGLQPPDLSAWAYARSLGQDFYAPRQAH